MGLTLKEFANAYGVDYGVVFEASYKVPKEPTVEDDRNYPEAKLYDEVITLLHARLFRAERRGKRLREQIHNANKARGLRRGYNGQG